MRCSRLAIAAVMGGAGLLAMAGAGRAAVIAYEPFDYPAGTSVSGTDGGTGWKANSSWSKAIPITSPGATYDSLPVAGNKVEGAASPFRLFAGSAITSGSIWVSFIAQASVQNTAVAISLLQGYSAIATVGDQYSPYWSIRANGTGAKTALSTDSDSSKSLLLARIDLNATGNSSAYLWVNPDLGAGAPAITSADASLPDMGLVIPSVDGLSFGLFGKPGDMLDEIRVGTTFADVAPVPEPASLSMLGLGGLMMLNRRRQRGQ